VRALRDRLRALGVFSSAATADLKA
jgi:hypothetical protein